MIKGIFINKNKNLKTNSTNNSKGKDDSDYLAFKETTGSYIHQICLLLNFFVQACTAAFSFHSNLLYDDNKYANGTMLLFYTSP